MRLRRPGPGFLGLAIALSCCCAAGVVGELQLSGTSRVQQAGRTGYVVPLSVRHGLLESQGRRLLKHGAIAPVLGAVREGYVLPACQLSCSSCMNPCNLPCNL